jgi:prepilin-type N-terminal cleavage/methylation domain-containing protein/prepilin-type processing-associated H-X9-DG protein
MQGNAMHPRPRGLTLLEVLVVLAVIGVVVALLLPAVQSAREAARRIHCASNLKQIALACLAYHDQVGSFPPGNNASDDGTYSGTWWGWTSAILPGLEQQPLFDGINFASSASAPSNSTVCVTMLPCYLCPSDASAYAPRLVPWADASYTRSVVAAPLNYAACSGDTKTGTSFDRYSGDPTSLDGPKWAGWPWAVNLGCKGTFRGVFGDCSNARVVRLAEVTDGSSSTFLAGEQVISMHAYAAWPINTWTYGSTVIPLNWSTHLHDGEAEVDGTICQFGSAYEEGPHCYFNWSYAIGFRSRHPGGAEFAMADGSVRFVKQSIDHRTYNALGTRAAGELISGQDF